MEKVTKQGIKVKGKLVSIGIDVHKASWNVTAVHNGEEILSATIPAGYESLKKLLKRIEGARIQIAYEAGYSGFRLYDQIRADGMECRVTPPSLVPNESGNRVKTDRRDSKKLGYYLDKGLLRGVWVLSPEARAHRQLVRTRRQMVEHRSDVMRQIKSLVMFHGIEPSPGEGQSWSRAFVEWLGRFECDVWLRRAVDSLLGVYEYLTEQVKALTREVVRLSRTAGYGQRVGLLRSIPGVGLLSAMELLVELQEVERFASADKLAAYIGLTPSQYSSGERVRMGRITHVGNGRLRTVLVECSWMLIGKDVGLRASYESIKHRRGAKRAIIAIARRLIIRIRSMLLHNEPYRIAMCSAA
jgi:transposase